MRTPRKWTPERDDYLRRYYGTRPRREIAEALGVTIHALTGRAKALGICRPKEPRWLKDDIRFLRENWGRLSIKQLANRLNRTEYSILAKARRLKLGPICDPSCFSKQDLTKLLGVDHRKIDRWVENGWLKASIAKTKRPGYKSRQILQVKPEHLEDFLRRYPDQWDGRCAGDIIRALREKELAAERVKVQRMEGVQKRRIPEHLKPAFAKFVAKVATDGAERIKAGRRKREWLREKVNRDRERDLPREGLRWTEEEDAALRRMFRQGKTYAEIGNELGRSVPAVGHRIARIIIWEKSGSG